MQLNSDELNGLADLASRAARRAGALIADHARREVTVLRKEGGDSLASQVVTEVDELSQSVILEELGPSLGKYDLALLTEESADDGSRHRKDYFWCIDPMDGTLPFTRGIPGYSVSIALVSREGVPLVGVIFDPVEGRLVRAVRGQGIRMNDTPWTLPDALPAAQRMLVFYCDCTFEEDPERERLSGAMEQFAEAEGYAGGEVRIGGGAVLNAWQVLQHPPAVYFKKPKPKLGGGSFWDFAATACVFEEAGAYVRDFHGKPLELNSATHSFFNHCGVCYTTEPELAGELRRSFGT